MKHIFSLMLLLCLCAGARAESRSVSVRTAKGETRVTFLSNRIVRVEHGGELGPTSRRSMVVTLEPQNDQVNIKESKSRTELRSDVLTATVDRRTGLVSFASPKGNLVKEKSFDVAPRPSVTYTLEADEPIYGLGTLQDGKLNRRGTERRLMEQSNLEDFQYVVQSLKGYGIYWDTEARADFVDNAEGMTFRPEVGSELTYYLMFGGSADGVNRLMRQLSGQVPMFPLWTFGYWQCRERYKSWKELTEVVDWHRRNQVPLDGIIQDWQYWGSNYTWNAMDFLNEDFQDSRRVIRHIHDQGAHLMISIWQSFGPMTPQYRELDSLGLLMDFETWPQSGLPMWPPRRDYMSGVRVYDPFSADGRDIYWKHLRRLHQYDIDAWWMDSTDPDQFDITEEQLDRPVGQSPSKGATPLGTYRSLRNAFPLACVSGVYDHQRAQDREKRVFIMTRSAFAGQQRYGSGLWSGDVTSSWDVLRRQIPLGLNYTMTGCPNFNTDIGGFFCGRYNTQGNGSAPRNPRYQELYVRWLQYGLLCPVFRSHGADAPREIYQFSDWRSGKAERSKKGQPVFDAIEASIRLRYRLLPYIYSTAWAVTSEGEYYLRALVYDFPQDRRTWDLGDEFMFGRSLLALPIVRPQFTDEETDGPTEGIDFTQTPQATKYLPKGCDWWDFWTESRYRGGQDVTLSTPLCQAPMMVRAGSILPLAPVMQWAGQRKWDDLEIVVYPGADAKFTLYEDEGDSYRYEQGQYAIVPMEWNDRTRRLTIDRRNGQFPGVLLKRTFRIRLAGQQGVKTVEYDGGAQTVQL